MTRRGSREASVELVDVADYGLPLLDEPLPAASGHDGNAHTRRCAARRVRVRHPGVQQLHARRAEDAIDYLTGFDAIDVTTYSGVRAPSGHQETALTTMLDGFLAWSHALRMLRDPPRAPIPAGPA